MIVIRRDDKPIRDDRKERKNNVAYSVSIDCLMIK